MGGAARSFGVVLALACSLSSMMRGAPSARQRLVLFRFGPNNHSGPNTYAGHRGDLCRQLHHSSGHDPRSLGHALASRGQSRTFLIATRPSPQRSKSRIAQLLHRRMTQRRHRAGDGPRQRVPASPIGRHACAAPGWENGLRSNVPADRVGRPAERLSARRRLRRRSSALSTCVN